MCVQAVKSEQSDLERIQDLFPGDALRLYDRDPLTMRMKALIRKRTTTAARLTRALSAKRIDSNAEIGTLPKERPTKRVFLLENPVQFTSVCLEDGFSGSGMMTVFFVSRVFKVRTGICFFLMICSSWPRRGPGAISS